MDSPEDYLINMAAEGHAGALEEFVSHQGEGALGPKVCDLEVNMDMAKAAVSAALSGILPTPRKPSDGGPEELPSFPSSIARPQRLMRSSSANCSALIGHPGVPRRRDEPSGLSKAAHGPPDHHHMGPIPRTSNLMRANSASARTLSAQASHVMYPNSGGPGSAGGASGTSNASYASGSSGHATGNKMFPQNPVPSMVGPSMLGSNNPALLAAALGNLSLQNQAPPAAAAMLSHSLHMHMPQNAAQLVRMQQAAALAGARAAPLAAGYNFALSQAQQAQQAQLLAAAAANQQILLSQQLAAQQAQGLVVAAAAAAAQNPLMGVLPSSPAGQLSALASAQAHAQMRLQGMQMGMGAAVAAGAQTMQPSLASMAHAHQQQQQQLAAQLAASAHMSQLHAALTSQQQQAMSVPTHGHALSSSPNRGSPPLGHGMMSHMSMLPTSHGSSNSASNHAHGADASGMGHMDMAILGVFERSSRSAIATAKAQADVSMQQQLQREHGLLLAALNVLLGVARGSGKEDDAAADLSFLCVSAQRQQADADHAAPTESAKAAISALAHAVYLLVCPERSASLHAAAYRLLIAMAEADGELMSLVTGLLCSPTPTPASAGGHSGEAARELAANMVANLTQIAVINRAVLAGEDAGPGPPGMVSAADYSEDDGPALPVTRTRSAPASVVARSQPAIMPYGPAGMLRGSWEDAAAGLAVKTATMLTGRGSGTLGLEQTTTGALPVVVEGQEHTLSCMHGMAEAHMHEGLARTVSLPQPDMQGCMQLGHMQMYDISNAGGLEHGMSYGGGLGRSMSLSASHADACASYSAHLSSSPRGSPNDRSSISSGGMKPRSVDGLSASLSGGGASTSSSGSSLNSGIVARSPSAMLMPIPEDGRVADVGGRSLSQSPGIFGSLGAFPPSFGAAASTAGANDFGPPRENAGRNSTRQSMSPFSSFTNASGGGGLNGAPWLQDGQASLGPVFCALEQQQ